MWRIKSRVEAASVEQALTSDSIAGVGGVRQIDSNSAVWKIGFGFEVWIQCPDDKPHCKSCGSVRKDFTACVECVPRATRVVQPERTKVATGKLSSAAKKRKSRKPRKKLAKAPTADELAKMLEQLKMNLS